MEVVAGHYLAAPVPDVLGELMKSIKTVALVAGRVIAAAPVVAGAATAPKITPGCCGRGR